METEIIWWKLQVEHRKNPWNTNEYFFGAGDRNGDSLEGEDWQDRWQNAWVGRRKGNLFEWGLIVPQVSFLTLDYILEGISCSAHKNYSCDSFTPTDFPYSSLSALYMKPHGGRRNHQSSQLLTLNQAFPYCLHFWNSRPPTTVLRHPYSVKSSVLHTHTHSLV